MAQPSHLLLLCTTLLAAPLAHAAPPKAAPAPAAKAVDTVGLVIWGGGAAPADADAALKSFEASGLRSSLPPAKLFSTDVKGLRPGFHIAVLGACGRAQANAVLGTIRGVQPDAYVRWIPREGAVAKLGCPTIELQPEPAEGSEEPAATAEEYDPEAPKITTQEETIAAGALKLTVKVTSEITDYSEIQTSSWSARAELHRGKVLVDARSLEAPDWAQVTGFSAKADSITLDTRDLTQNCVGSEFLQGDLVHRVFRIAKGKIQVTESSVPEFEACQPSHEGLDPCAYGCQYRRYEAIAEACSGADSRDACQAAIDAYEANAEPCNCDGEEPLEDSTEEPPGSGD